MLFRSSSVNGQWADIAGATGATYAVTAAGKYRCAATNPSGTNYSDEAEVKLAQVLMTIKSLEESGKSVPDAKADNETVKAFMSLALPNYDRERVYTSDMKKLFVWYNTLKSTDLDWAHLDKEESDDEETAADAPKAGESKAKKATAAPKKIVPSKTATGAKSKTTTPRKMGS